MVELAKEQETNSRALYAELASVKEIQRLFGEINVLASIEYEEHRIEQKREGLRSPTFEEMQELNQTLWLKEFSTRACGLAARREQKIIEALKIA